MQSTRPEMRIVHRGEDADPNAICVWLYGSEARTMGWFIGPTRIERGQLKIPYLARSDKKSAAVALVQAMVAAILTGDRICIVDPFDLWALI